MMRETTEIGCMKRDDGLRLSQSWKPLIHFLKERRKPLPHTQCLSWPAHIVPFRTLFRPFHFLLSSLLHLIPFIPYPLQFYPFICLSFPLFSVIFTVDPPSASIRTILPLPACRAFIRVSPACIYLVLYNFIIYPTF